MIICLSFSILFSISQILLIFFIYFINGAKLTSEKDDLFLFSIKENSPIGSVVGKINTPGFYPPFEIHEFQEKNITVVKESGVIRVVDLLDREKRNAYSFLIISSNGDTKNLKVNILDENDNSPVFNSTSLEKVIPENYPVGSKIDLTSVYDPDLGVNSIENIVISAGDPDGYFAVDFYNGGNGFYYVRLVLMRQLDFETITQYNMVLQANDGGSPRLRASLFLKIIIENANDNAPKFDLSRYAASVREDQSLGEIVMQVRATDRDNGSAGQLTYFLDLNNPDSNFFSMNPQTGEISLKVALDYERQRQLSLSVAVRDSVLPYHTSRASLTVDVVDVNDNPPEIQISFPQQRKEIDLSADFSPLVAHISVVDLDSVSTDFFLAIVNKCPLKLEKILPKMWQLTTTNQIRNISTDSITVVLEASDYPPPSLKSSAEITIIVKRRPVTAIKFSRTIFITEVNSPVTAADEAIAIITLNDSQSSRDQGGLRFSLFGPEAQLFKIMENDGRLLSNTAIDCGQYDIGVSLFAKNNLVPLDKSTIRVIIKGTTKWNLYFSKGFHRIILTKSMTKVKCPFKITVGNRHCNKKVTYRMETLTKDAGGSFHINNSGDICEDSYNRVNDYQRHLYKIVASENNSKDASTNVLVIKVPSVSELQMLVKGVIVSPSPGNKTVPVARVIATFRSRPPYIYYGIIQYTLKTTTSEPNVIAINSVTGEIYVSSSLSQRKVDYVVEIVPMVNKDLILSHVTTVTLSFGGSKTFRKSLYEFYISSDKISSNLIAIGQVKVIADDSPAEYQLVQSTFGEIIFSIDSRSGTIHARNIPPRDHIWSLNVLARWPTGDQCYCQVLIFVDCVTSPPSLHFTSMAASIWENATAGTELIQVIPNIPSWSDRFSISYGRFSESFTIDERSGQVFLRKTLDRETNSRAIITVELTNRWGSVKTDINIEIVDTNDNSPDCREKITDITLQDNTPIEYVTCPITCSDADTADNGYLTYQSKLVHPNGVRSPLAFNELNGCLEVVSSLDLWKTNTGGSFTYLVTVSDNGRDGSRFSEIKISVNIIDTNNHSPVLMSYPVFHIPENAAPGTVLGKLLFDDEDPNDKISLLINDPRYNQWFYTESTSPRSSLIRTRFLHAIPLGYHRLVVKLIDNRIPSQFSLANVTVVVDDSDNHNPVILYPKDGANISYPCSLIPGSMIFSVKASDKDHGCNSRLNYFLKDDNEMRAFVLDSLTGALTTRLQPSCLRSTKLDITVFDMGHLRRNTSVSVFLVPYRSGTSNNPRNVTFIIPDNPKPGMLLGILLVDSQDTMLGTKYLFSGESPTSLDNVLHIDYDNQRLILLRTDDKFFGGLYSITAIFHRAIVPPRSHQFTLRLQTDKLDTSWPYLPEEKVVIRVKENQPPGTIVANLSTSKSKLLSVVYSLHQPSDYFLIDSTDGVLMTFMSLDREDMVFDEFPIEIVATSACDPIKSMVIPVLVVVEDVNDNAPTIISPVNTTIDVAHRDVANETIVRVVAVDKDKGRNGMVKYRIDGDGPFTIDANTGDISLTNVPVLFRYDVNVSVEDHGNPPLVSWRLLTFILKQTSRENIIRFQTKTLSMNLSIATVQRHSPLGKVTLANWPSSTNSAVVRFHLIAGNFSHLFEIDPVSGIIRLSRQPSLDDLGRARALKLSVVAYMVSDSSNYDIAQLLIHIDHGNKYSPTFAKTKFVVKLPDGEAITDFLTVAADDPDLGVFGIVTYSLLGDISDQRITIDSNTGRLSCSALHYLDRKIYNLEVVATDSLGGPLSKNQSALVQVQVQNSVLQSFHFNSSHFIIDVKENLPRGYVIGRITVQSKSLPLKVVYLLNPGHALININSTSGQLATNGPFDRESTPFIDVTIHAISVIDNFYHVQSSRATVTIRITDVNDNQPIPTHNPFIVYIDNPSNVPSPLLQLSATDRDSTSNIGYNFDLEDPNTRTLSSQYYLDQTLGILRYRFGALKSGFRSNILSVIISDGGPQPMTTKVFVFITTEREGGLLTIAPEKAVFRLPENPPVGVFIGQIHISGGNCTSGKSSVSVIDGVDKDLVHVHSATGKIFVSSAHNVDREKTSQIVLWTEVRCLESQLVGFKKVTIQVEDVDDNAPVFSQKEYEAFVLEGQPPQSAVTRTMVYDPDEGINRQVEYFIEMYSPVDEFSIDLDGTIRTNIPLNFHTKSLYTLIVKATSKSTPLLFAECRVTVHVINTNDQRPLFSAPVHHIRISEDKAVGSLLATVTATDSDGPDRISYRIRPRSMVNSTRFLTIAYDSGEVYLARRLKTADVGRHEVDIVADDSKYSSTTVLVVDVTDINNEYPVLLEDGNHFLIADFIDMGSVIGYLNALDRDEGVNGRVGFEIIPAVPWLTVKDFHNNTAVMYLVGPPPIEDKVFFVGLHLYDQASDRANRLSSVSTIALITVGSNAHSPHISNGSNVILNLKDSTPIGSKIALIDCKDKEDLVTYRINSSLSRTPFHIDSFTGEIFLVASLKKYPQSIFHDTILCLDDGKPMRRTSVLLTVNIQRPLTRSPTLIHIIENVTLEINRDSRYPVFVRNTRNSEKYRCDNCIFSLLSAVPCDRGSSGDHIAKFHVDPIGNLWLNGTMESSSWNIIFKIIRKDAIGTSSSDLYHSSYIRTSVIITRTQQPQSGMCISIDRLTAVVRENKSPGASVIQLPRWYTDIRYLMAEDEFFQLSCVDYPSASSCRIITRTVLDFERNERFDLNLVVSGSTVDQYQCSHSLSVAVSVLDVDEFAPVFSQSEYSHSVPGGVPELGRLLLTVQASDGDRGRYGLVYYQLEGNDNEHFGIRNDSGQIFIRTAFISGNESHTRWKRSVKDKEQGGFQRKTFTMEVIASSGERSTTVIVRLKMLVPLLPDDTIIPGSVKHVSLIIGLLISVLIVIVIVALALIIRRRRFCQRPHPPMDQSHTDSDGRYQDQICRDCSRKHLDHEYQDPCHPCDEYNIHFHPDQNYPDLIAYDMTQGCDTFSGDHSLPSSNNPDGMFLPQNVRPSDVLYTNDPSSSQFCDGRIHVPYTDTNQPRGHIIVTRKDGRNQDSDHSCTSSSCYSSISQRGLTPRYPQVPPFNVSDQCPRTISGPTDYTMIPTNRYSLYKRKHTASSLQLEKQLEFTETIPLRHMEGSMQHSCSNIIRNNHQSRITLTEDATNSAYGHNSQLVSHSGGEDKVCKVISVDEPPFGAIYNHSQSSSNRQDISNAQTYSDITDIDS